MSLKRHPFRSWVVAGGLVAAVAVALGTIGDATSTWHDFFVWVNGRLYLGENSFLLSHEKLLFLLALLAGAVLLGLLKWIGSRLAAAPRKRVSRQGQTKEERTRAAYLEYLEEDVNGRLAASIHRARFLDLGMDEAQGATLPWHYKHHDPDAEAEVFTSIDQAFDGFKRRLLLLGAPGAGKSTTLLHLVRRLLEEAKNNPEAPVPVLLNLSSYKGPVPKRRFPFLRERRETRTPEDITAFDQWLVQQLKGLPVRDIRKLARSWVDEGRIALLLDGLDEVAESRVGDLVRDLNESFFWRHPDLSAVICSRIFDYQRIAEDREMKLRLQGAVTLQPLTSEQVDLYLTAAQAEGLRDALLGDAELRELASTPLTLSMMVLAYGGLAPSEIPANLPLVERRRHLFDNYVARMLQRKERRDRGQPFDTNPEADIPLTYSLDRVNRYLGWLAVRLSERSLTEFRPSRMASLLGQKLRLQRTAGWSSLRLAFLLSTTILSMAIAAGLLFHEEDWAMLTFYVGALGPISYWFSYQMQHLALNRPRISNILGLAVLAPLCCAAFGLLANSLATILSIHTPFMWASSTTLCLVMVLGLGALNRPELSRVLIRSAAWVAIPLIISLVLQLYSVALWLPVLAFSLVIARQVTEDEGIVWHVMVGGIAAIMGVLSAFGWAVMLLVGPPDHIRVATLVCWFLGMFMKSGTEDDSFLSGALGLSSGAFLGMTLGGPSAASWGAVLLMAFNFGTLPRFGIILKESVINPVLFSVLICQGYIPVRYRKFLAYATDAMLVKRSGREYEFVHRLVRDHFAVRELAPLLHSIDGQVNPDIIERLSLLGESSLDSLAELTSHPNAAIRQAAVGGLGRIRTPSAIPILNRVISSEPAPIIRAQAVEALAGFSSGDVFDSLMLALKDVDPQVRMAAVCLAKSNHFRHLSVALVCFGLADREDVVLAATVQALGEISSDSIFGDILKELEEHEIPIVLKRIRTLLADSSLNVQWAALKLIGVLRDCEAVSEVQAAASARSVKIRVAALRTLGQIAGPDAIPFIKPALFSWRDELRRAALEAIGNIGSRLGVGSSQSIRDDIQNYLIRALKDVDGEVRATAVVALSSFKHGVVEAALKRSLRDPYRKVRDAAESVLRQRQQENHP